MRGRQLRIVSFLIAAFVAVWLLAVPAMAQTDGPDYVGATPPSTLVNATVAQPSHGGELPRTGAEIGALVLVAGGLIVVGRRMMRRSSTGTGTNS